MTGAMKGSTRNAQLQVLLAYENVPLNLAIHELRLKYPKMQERLAIFASRCGAPIYRDGQARSHQTRVTG